MVVFAHVPGVVDVGDVQDHVLVAACQREDVFVGGEGIVHAARQTVVGDFRGDFRMRGIRKVQDHYAVAPVGGPLASHGRVARVGRHLHVVDRTCIDLNRVRLDDAPGVGHVPDEAVAIGPLGPGERVIAAVAALEDPEVGRPDPLFPALALDLQLLDDVPGDDAERGARGQGPRVGDDRVDPRDIRDKTAAAHLCRCGRGHDPVRFLVGVGPLDGDAGEELAVRVAHFGAEVHDVAGAGAGDAADDLQGLAREGVGGHGGRAFHPVDRGGDGGRAGGDRRDAPEAVDGRDIGRPATPFHRRAGARAAVTVFGPGDQAHRGADQETRVRGGCDDDPRHGGPVDGDRHTERDGIAARRRALCRDEGRDERELPSREGGDGSLPHPHRQAGTDQPHPRCVHAGAGARDPGHRDLSLVTDPHGQLGWVRNQPHDRVVGLGLERGRTGERARGEEAPAEQQASE